MSDRYNDVFPTRLRQLIEEMPTTITALARELGISRQAVSQYTMGQGQPNADKLVQIAEYFDVSCDWLVGRKDSAKSFEAGLPGTCKFLGMDEECVLFLQELGSFSQNYPNALHALLTHPKFQEVMRSVVKFHWLLEHEAEAIENAKDLQARNQWMNAIFMENFMSTTKFNEILREWNKEFRGERPEIDYDALLGRKEDANG